MRGWCRRAGAGWPDGQVANLAAAEGQPSGCDGHVRSADQALTKAWLAAHRPTFTVGVHGVPVEDRPTRSPR